MKGKMAGESLCPGGKKRKQWDEFNMCVKGG